MHELVLPGLVAEIFVFDLAMMIVFVVFTFNELLSLNSLRFQSVLDDFA